MPVLCLRDALIIGVVLALVPISACASKQHPLATPSPSPSLSIAPEVAKLPQGAVAANIRFWRLLSEGRVNDARRMGEPGGAMAAIGDPGIGWDIKSARLLSIDYGQLDPHQRGVVDLGVTVDIVALPNGSEESGVKREDVYLGKDKAGRWHILGFGQG
jgi:hypothetical protein